MHLSQPIEFCFHLWKLKIPLGLPNEFFQYLIPNSLVENTFLHVPLNHFLDHELYKQLLNIRRPQFHIISIIQFSRHLITSITSILIYILKKCKNKNISIIRTFSIPFRQLPESYLKKKKLAIYLKYSSFSPC